MTDPLTPQPHDEPAPDETFTWTGDQEGDSAEGHAEHADRSTGSTGSSDSAGSTGASGSDARPPAARPRSSRPSAKRSTTWPSAPARPSASSRRVPPNWSPPPPTRPRPSPSAPARRPSEASGKLAQKSRSWASDLHASVDADAADATGHGTDTSSIPTPPPVTPDADRLVRPGRPGLI